MIVTQETYQKMRYPNVTDEGTDGRTHLPRVSDQRTLEALNGEMYLYCAGAFT